MEMGVHKIPLGNKAGKKGSEIGKNKVGIALARKRPCQGLVLCWPDGLGAGLFFLKNAMINAMQESLTPNRCCVIWEAGLCARDPLKYWINLHHHPNLLHPSIHPYIDSLIH